MDNKVINEIKRINGIMSGKIVLSEQIVPQILKKIFSVVDDDVARKVVRATDDSFDDTIRKLKAGENLSDDAIESLLKVIDYDFLAKSLVDQKLLGNQLNVNINKIIEALKKDASRYDELTLKMNNVIETFGTNQEFPQELIDAINKEVKSKIDNAIGGMSKYDVSPRILGKGERILIKNSVRLHHLKIARLFRDFFKDNKTLRDEIVSLVKGFQEGGSEYSQVYAIKIGEKLNVLESKMDRLGSDIWDQIKKDVPLDLRNKLDNIEVTKRWKELRDTIQTDETIGKTVQNGWEKFKETMPFKFKKGFPPIVFKKIPMANVTKLVNFVLTGQMQTTRELYERLVKAGAAKGSALTYLRAVAPTLLIPTVMALGKTIIGPTGKGIENAINSIGRFFEKDWDVNVTDWEPEVNDGKVNIAKTIKENFKSLVGDESSFFQYQGSDFIPGVNSYVDDLVNWYFTIGYKDPSSPPQPETTISDVRDNLSVEQVKLIAPEDIKDYIWSKDGDILLAGPNNEDYPITLEDGVYMVELPSGKIKLKEY